jgi:aminoglycoside phosphotransferase (APT) family kinase protein
MSVAAELAVGPRLRSYLVPLKRRWRSGTGLARAARNVPAILQGIGDLPLDGSAGGWAVQRAQSTDARVAVLTLGQPGGAPSAVLKLARTTEAKRSLSREAAVVTGLEADARLAEWRCLLPAILAQGEMDGSCYVLQRALAGRNAGSLIRDPSLRRHVQTVAAEAVRTLHRQTGASTVVDEECVARWLAGPLELIGKAIPASQGEAEQRSLERAAGEVKASLIGRRAMVSWIHGDFWLGNLLVTGDGATAAGILDWDFAGEQELSVLDFLHLVVYTRALVERRELGGVLRDLLGGGTWSAHELSLLRLRDHDVEDDSYERAALLLYWLRHVAGNLLQSAHYASNRLWLKRNVYAVLRCV